MLGRKIIPLAFIIFIAFLLFGPTLFPPEGKIIYGGDLERQFYFWKSYLKESLKSGIIPFWNPYNFSGTPFLAHPTTAFFYPATLIFLFLPLNLAFSWNYFFHFILAGIGMYFLGKQYGGILGGLTSASMLVLSGFFSSRIYAGHVDILSTAVWLPWVYLGAKNYFEADGKKNLVYFIIPLSLEILAGYQAVVIFTLELILLYALYKRLNADKYIFLILGIIASFTITTVQWLPTLEFVQLSIRAKGLSYQVASWGSLPLSGLQLFVNPFDKKELTKLAYGFTEGPLPNFFDYYTGSLSILLIPITIVWIILSSKTKLIPAIFKKIHSDFWFLIIGIAFFLLISLAQHSWFNLHRILYELIPFYRFFRIPAQHLIIVTFLVSVIVGIIIGNLKSSALKCLLILLIIVQLFSFSKKFFFLVDTPEVSFDKKLIDVLRRDNSLYRLLPDVRVGAPQAKALDFNATSFYKLHSTAGYDPIILLSYYRFINLINGEKNSEALIPLYHVEVPPVNPTSTLVNLLNAKHILLGSSWLSKEVENDKFYKLKSNSLYDLYRNENALPRFFFVPSVKIHPDNESLMSAIISGANNLSSEVHLIRKEAVKLPRNISFGCTISDTNKVDIVSYQPNKIILKIQSSCNGLLSSSEVYYPGWKAKIDNLDTNIIQSNEAFRTIYLPKGEHLVEFYYQPNIYYIGLAISATTLIIMMIFLIRSRTVNF